MCARIRDSVRPWALVVSSGGKIDGPTFFGGKKKVRRTRRFRFPLSASHHSLPHYK